MSTSFHYSDTPPQLFLDQLHEINVPRLFDPALNDTQRTNLITLTRKRLSEWQTRLVDQTKNVELRHKHRPQEAKLYAAPYKKLAALGDDLVKSVNDLERTLRAGKALPRGFQFGPKIFGTFETGEWHFGEIKDAKRWDEMEAVSRRLVLVKNDHEPLLRDMQLAQRRAKETKQDLKRLHRQHRRLRSKTSFVLLLGLVAAVMIASLVGGVVVLNQQPPLVKGDLNMVLGGSLLIIATAAAVLMVSMARRRRRNLAKVKDNIAHAIDEYRSHKAEAKELRLQLYPVHELSKQLTVEYKRLRKTFEE